MYLRSTRTQITSSSNIELEEKTHEPVSNDKNTRKKRFESPTRNMFKLNNNDNTTLKYNHLKNAEEQYSDLQFEERTSKIPIYAIILATALFLLGSLMITLGVLILTGYIQTQHTDRSWPLILIGSLIFLPGFYHIRIAYWAWKGEKNFSFDDIPDLDWS